MNNAEWAEFLSMCNGAANVLDRLRSWTAPQIDRFRYLTGEASKVETIVTPPGPGGWVAVREADGDWAWFKLHWPYPPDIREWALAQLAEEEELETHLLGPKQESVSPWDVGVYVKTYQNVGEWEADRPVPTNEPDVPYLEYTNEAGDVVRVDLPGFQGFNDQGTLFARMEGPTKEGA